VKRQLLMYLVPRFVDDKYDNVFFVVVVVVVAPKNLERHLFQRDGLQDTGTLEPQIHA